MTPSMQLLTMWRGMSRRTMLFVVAGVLGALFVVRAGVAWYTDLQQDLATSMDMKTVQYEKLVRLASGGEAYVREGETLQKVSQQLANKRLLVADSPSLAEALFQNVTKDMAKQANINIRALRTMPSTSKDGLPVLNMSINARAEIGAIRDFLLLVHNSERLIFFTQVEIKQISKREDRYYYFNAQLAALTKQ